MSPKAGGFFPSLVALTTLIIGSPAAHAQSFRTLFIFDGTDGGYPYPSVAGYCTDGEQTVGLFQSTNGDFYGANRAEGTFDGGTEAGVGTIYKLSVDLGAIHGNPGLVRECWAVVNILGTDLQGATRVTFNGTAAAFTVVSPTEITATVPAGASTGTMQVVTRRDALSSPVVFTVT
jgi:hypothetical protein